MPAAASAQTSGEKDMEVAREKNQQFVEYGMDLINGDFSSCPPCKNAPRDTLWIVNVLGLQHQSK
jgi:hypothetical protein